MPADHLTQFNVRLDPRTLTLIASLTRRLGVSQADVIRLAIRAYDEAHAGRPRGRRAHATKFTTPATPEKDCPC